MPALALVSTGAAPAPAPAPTGVRAASGPRASFGDALRQAGRPAPPPAAGPGSAAVPVLQAVEQARSRLDAVLAEARRGRTFSAGELLALQADAYRASQTLDLAARAVEQGAQAVRQAVNTQV
jgi:hypothetical protein